MNADERGLIIKRNRPPTTLRLYCPECSVQREIGIKDLPLESISRFGYIRCPECLSAIASFSVAEIMPIYYEPDAEVGGG
jgi:DNA-directed RNA polymerase subunit RPC12/RpoP